MRLCSVASFARTSIYRLGVFEIALPPLRERLDDVLELADTFLAEIGETVGRPAAGISREAREHLLAYAWPGNVRELRNAIERAVILADGGFIRSEHLPVTAPRPSVVKSDDTPSVRCRPAASTSKRSSARWWCAR
jgi:DNA-binding NtrC family response regulator